MDHGENMALGYAGKVGFKFFICNLKTTSGGLFKNLRSRHKWKTLFMFEKNRKKFLASNACGAPQRDLAC